MDDDTLRDAFAHGPDARPDEAFIDALEQRLRTAAAAPAPVVEMAEAEEPPLDHARRHRVGWRVVVALGTAAAVVAALVVIRDGTHSTTRRSFTLGDVAKATVGTARFETITTMPGTSTQVGTQSTTGEIDFTHHAAQSVSRSRVPTFAMSSSPLPTTQYRDITTEMLSVGGVQYQSIDFWFVMFGGGVPASLHGKKWVRFDVDEQQQSSATSSTLAATSHGGAADSFVPDLANAAAIGSHGFFLPSSGDFTDPAGILDQLRQDGATLTGIGSGRVRGVAVQRYRVTLHTSVPGRSIEIDVDAQSRLRRWIMQDDLAAQNAALPKNEQPNNSASLRGSLRIETDLFDFGVPVHLTAPPASEVVTLAELTRALEYHPSPLIGIGSSSKWSTATTTPTALAGPSTLTTKWHVVDSGTVGANWRVYQGDAPGWACYSFDLTTTSTSSTATVMLAGGTRAKVDDKDATCFTDTQARGAVLGEVLGASSLLVGVAAPDSHVTVTLHSGRDVALRADSTGVFQWSGTASDAASTLTIDRAGTTLLSCTTLPGGPAMTCDPSAQSFVVGQPSP
jgi:hypothetical protein